MHERPARQDGYAAISDYAAVGDGRTAALVAADGGLDWLCLPDLDSGSAFGALLDAKQGGAFRLAPVASFASTRRYLPDTNLLETTFTTATGSVRVTDAMPLPLDGLSPAREFVRSVEGLSGAVAMQWAAEPRFGYGATRTRLSTRAGFPVAVAGADALALLAFGAGEPSHAGSVISGNFLTREGSRGLLALSAAHGEPLVFSPRSQIERRLTLSAAYWREWSARRRYAGPWRAAVVRSALALKLLIHAPSGAIAAAATTSLPEQLGGVRNWDYRYSWVRDSSAALDALVRLGCPVEADAFLWWLMHASQLTHPRLSVLYKLNGRAQAPERELPLAGYRGSRPVRVGNAAAPQLQLDVYGHLLHTAWVYATAGGVFPGGAPRRLADTADLVCGLWQAKDSGIWEVRSEPQHFTESKMMCWIALDRACKLGRSGKIPAAGLSRWEAHADGIARFVSEHCWSPTLQSYERYPGADALDASVLLPALLAYGGASERGRLLASAAAIRERLGGGALLYRYLGDDGLPGEEGAFLACSFWLVDALARLGSVDQAGELMDTLLARANDVGLYAEEIDVSSGEFLGNFPQALVHLALINAGLTLEASGAS